MASLSDILGGVGIAAQPLIQQRQQEKELLMQLVAQAPELARDPAIATALQGAFLTPGLSGAFTGLEGVQDERAAEAREQAQIVADQDFLRKLQGAAAPAGVDPGFGDVESGLAAISSHSQAQQAAELDRAAAAERTRVQEIKEEQDFRLEIEEQKGLRQNPLEKALLASLKSQADILDKLTDEDEPTAGASQFAGPTIESLEAQKEQSKDQILFLNQLQNEVAKGSFFDGAGESLSLAELQERVNDPAWVKENQDEIEKASMLAGSKQAGRDVFLQSSPEAAAMLEQLEVDFQTEVEGLRREREFPGQRRDIPESTRSALGAVIPPQEEPLFPAGANLEGGKLGAVDILVEEVPVDIQSYVVGLPEPLQPFMLQIVTEHAGEPEVMRQKMDELWALTYDLLLLERQGGAQ